MCFQHSQSEWGGWVNGWPHFIAAKRLSAFCASVCVCSRPNIVVIFFIFFNKLYSFSSKTLPQSKVFWFLSYKNNLKPYGSWKRYKGCQNYANGRHPKFCFCWIFFPFESKWNLRRKPENFILAHFFHMWKYVKTLLVAPQLKYNLRNRQKKRVPFARIIEISVSVHELDHSFLNWEQSFFKRYGA